MKIRECIENIMGIKTDNIVVWKDNHIIIKKVKRKSFKKRYEKVLEAKKIAAKEIGCEFVDGLNLIIDGKYYGGIYCDDLARMNRDYRGNLKVNDKYYEMYGDIIVINEQEGLSIQECKKIVEYLILNKK